MRKYFNRGETTPKSGDLAALRVYDNASGMTKDGLISNQSEFSSLTSNGCRAGERANWGFRSVYERQTFRTASSVGFVATKLEAVLSLPADTFDVELRADDSNFRSAIEQARATLSSDFSDPFLRDRQELTLGLNNAITRRLQN